MALDTARDDFGARQAEMTARWYENVKRAHGDVGAYIVTRHAAYLDRWNEATRFIPRGSHVLDIGGGNLFPALIRFFIDHDFRYTYVDVDPAAVESSRSLAQAEGLENASFSHGYNDVLKFADGAFNAVFSSHCLEHSIDLKRTFSELNRVLEDNGVLLMAVPFGWESNPEHPYFFGPQEWISILIDSGFRIRVAQIGSEYPEFGHDYFIACQKIGPAGDLRISAEDYTKESFDFAPCVDTRLSYYGDVVQKDDHVILIGGGSYIEFAVPDGAREVLPVLGRHDWSGIVEVSCNGQVVVEDLYSWFSYVQPVRISFPEPSKGAIVNIRCNNRNPLSFSNEVVIHGVHYR